MNANKQDAGGEVTNPDNAGGLPELPRPEVIDMHFPTGVKIYGYTREQMRAYGELCRAAPAGGDENGSKVKPTLDMRGRLTFDVAAAVKNGQFADEIEGSRKLGEMLRKRRALSVDRIWLADLAWIADNIANMTPGVAQESLRKIRDTIDARLAEEDRDKPKDSAPAGSGEVEPLPVFSGNWIYVDTGQRFSGADLDGAAFAVYEPILRKLQQGAE